MEPKQRQQNKYVLLRSPKTAIRNAREVLSHALAPRICGEENSAAGRQIKPAAELVVFEKVGDEGKCSECGAELLPGDFLLMEKGQPLCLTCADLDRLVFLPAGDTALSRRARKHSSLAAVVVRFNRARKRYERQGLLVTEEALAKAEEECAADAPARAAARSRAALARQEEDREFVAALAQAILLRHPGCPSRGGPPNR